MFINLQDKEILVVGGGKVALRKTGTLVRFCEKIRVVAPAFLQGFEQLQVTCICRKFRMEDLNETDLAIIATDDAQLNEKIAARCREQGIICNVASDRKLCDFYFPAVLEQDGVVIGIGSSGNPAKSRAVREQLEAQLKKHEEV